MVGPIVAPVLRARERLKRPVPYVGFLLGGMSRGALSLYGEHRLRTYDVLVENCEADAALARNFFPNARVRSIPFAFDETSYYPGDDASTRTVREALGIPVNGKMLLYVGRITLEKNLRFHMRYVVEQLLMAILGHGGLFVDCRTWTRHPGRAVDTPANVGHVYANDNPPRLEVD